MGSYSKFFEVLKLNGLSNKAVINVLKQNFARYGIPIKLYSDSGKKGKRKVQVVSQSQNKALPRPQEEEETDKSKQAQIEQTYEKHYD